MSKELKKKRCRCGKWFLPTRGRKHCSKQCQKDAAYHRRMMVKELYLSYVSK